MNTTSLLLKPWPLLTHKHSVLVILLMLMGCATLFRFWHLSTQSYWMDEGYTINAVLSIEEHGSTILDSGKNYSCPTYCYPTALFAKSFGDNPFSYRLLAILGGVASVALIFYITRRLFTTQVALIAAFFTTFSYYQIAWSRQARWYTLFSIFFWLAIYFFYEAYTRAEHRKRNSVLTLIFTILSIATHGLGYLLPLIFVGWILFDRIVLQKKFSLRKEGLILALGFLIGAYLFSFMKIGLHYELPYYLNFYLRNYWLFIVFGTLGFFSKSAFASKEKYFLLFVFAAYFLSLSFLTNIVHYRYLFHVTPIFFILGALGMYEIHTQMHSYRRKAILWATVLWFFFTIGGGVAFPLTYYYLESDNPDTLTARPYYAYTPQPNWNAAYDFIATHKEADDLIIGSHPQFTKIFLHQPGYWLKYDYLGFYKEEKTGGSDTEYYVGAKIIDDLGELKTLTEGEHGFVVFDYMSIENRIPIDIISYIQTNFDLVFHEKTNVYSEVWVYEF